MFSNKIAASLCVLALITATPAEAASKIPHRIISLSPSATEDLFAIGAGKQVIAVDDYSNFPKSAPTTKLSGFTPNIEAIIKYHPDFVVIQSTATKSDSVIKQLKLLKITTYVEHTPNNISEAYSEISDLGVLTGNQNNAKKLITTMKRSIAETLYSSKLKISLTFFHELDSTLYSATSATFIGKVYADFNLVNIADAAAKADDAGYPKLQSEFIVQSNPDLIFLADGAYGESMQTVALRPGWANIKAVLNKKVISLPEDIPSRWGPRLIDFYKFIAGTLI